MIVKYHSDEGKKGLDEGLFLTPYVIIPPFFKSPSEHGLAAPESIEGLIISRNMVSL